jgi:hypothetical protein
MVLCFIAKQSSHNDNEIEVKFRLLACPDQLRKAPVLTNITVTIYKLVHVDVKEHIVGVS